MSTGGTTASSATTSTASNSSAVTNFKTPFKPKVQKRKDDCGFALTSMNWIVTNALGKDGTDWSASQQEVQALQGQFGGQVNAAQQNPKGAGKAFKQTLAETEEAASKVAEALMDLLIKDQEDKKLKSDVFKQLSQSYKAASNKKSSKDSGGSYATFVTQAADALAKRDHEMGQWNAIANQFGQDKAEVTRIHKRALALKLSTLKTAAEAPIKYCNLADENSEKAEFGIACVHANYLHGLVPNLQAQCQQLTDPATTTYNSAGAVLIAPYAQAKDLMESGGKQKMGWLKSGAIRVCSSMQTALEMEAQPNQQQQALAAAWQSVADLVALQDRVDGYDAALADWNKTFRRIQTWEAQAKAFAKEGDKRNPKLQWLVDGAKLYLTEIVTAKDYAKNNDPAKASLEALRPNSKFSALRDKFNKLQKQELTQDYQQRVAANKKGPEAKLEGLLDTKVINDRMVNVKNSVAAAKELGSRVKDLSPGHAIALFSYTTNDYDDINKMKLGLKEFDPEKKKQLDGMVEVIEDALAQLEPYKGGPTRRGESDWKDADKQYAVGNKFKIAFFWSTGDGFSFPGKYQITITPKGKGRKIEAFSEYVQEGEVVYPPKTEFRVTGRKVVSAQRVEVDVEEVV